MLAATGLQTADKEELRLRSLEELVPKNRRTLLDVGARDGRVTARLAPYFSEATALDLDAPHLDLGHVRCIAGDATRLQFPDDAFDVVVCSEVIEHIPHLEQACRELRRVARHEVVVGVPYKQDLRVRRLTCNHCGEAQAPNGHLHTFDERRLEQLFGLRVVDLHFVGERRGATTDLGCALMDAAGNPWGSYGQQEPCLYCNRKMTRPSMRSLWQRGVGFAALALQKAATALQPVRAGWSHVLFAKE